MGMQIEDLPAGSRPPALRFEHFPTRWQAVVWRNWNLVAPERIGEVMSEPRYPSDIIPDAHASEKVSNLLREELRKLHRLRYI